MKKDEKIELQTLREKQKSGEITKIELARLKVLKIYEELDVAKENEVKIFNKEVSKIWEKLKPIFMDEERIEALKNKEFMEVFVGSVEQLMIDCLKANQALKNQGEIKNE